MSMKTPRMSPDGEYIAPLGDRIGQIYDLIVEKIAAIFPSFLKWDKYDKDGNNITYKELSAQVQDHLQAVESLLGEIKKRGEGMSSVNYKLLEERIKEHKIRIDLLWIHGKVKEYRILLRVMSIINTLDESLHAYGELKGSEWWSKLILDIHIGLSLNLSKMDRYFHKLKKWVDDDLL